MRVLVIGASGRVGKKLCKRLLNEGHQVFGTTRKDEKLFEEDNYTQVNLDLSDPLEEVKHNTPEGLDAFIFVSGSRGKNLLQVDLHGAVQSMKVAQQLGVKRYIMLSSIFSLAPEQWKGPARESLYDYMIAKHYADQWLIEQTDLDYTILQPGGLTEKDGSGKIEVNVNSAGENSIENVANTLYTILKRDNTIGKVIPMKDGDQDIEKAISIF